MFPSGRNVGGLNVKVREIGTNTTKVLWSVDGSVNATANNWQKALVNVGQRSLFRVRIFKPASCDFRLPARPCPHEIPGYFLRFSPVWQ